MLPINQYIPRSTDGSVLLLRLLGLSHFNYMPRLELVRSRNHIVCDSSWQEIGRHNVTTIFPKGLSSGCLRLHDTCICNAASPKDPSLLSLWVHLSLVFPLEFDELSFDGGETS